jgi:hypothetical protein
MKNFFIITPTFNDWRSLNKVLHEIDKKVSKMKGKFSVIVINDASTIKPNLKLKRLKKLKKITIITNKKNLGSQKSISIGLKYLQKIKTKSIITIIDSDGEDDPKKIKELINQAQKNPQSIITANRLKRKENIIYNFFYKIHLLITFILTGKYIDFGNYSSFNSKNLNNLLRSSDAFLAYSAAIAKNAKNIKSNYISKKKRYYDKSKVKILFLIQHSINIISVFRFNVLRLSILFCIFLILLNLITNSFLIYFIITFVIIFNIIVNYKHKNKSNLKNYLNFIDNIRKYKN